MKIQSTNDVKNQKVDFCVYGASGTGKTRLVSTIPGKALILNTDKGLLTLSKFKIDYVTATTWKEIDEFMKFIAKPETAAIYQWIVVDSFSVVGEILAKHLKEEKKLTGFDFFREYGDKISNMISLIRDQDHYNTLSIFEATSSEDENGIRQFKFGLQGKSADKAPYYFDIVLASQAKKKGDILSYYLQTQAAGGYICKDRSGALLPQEEPNIGIMMNKILGINKAA